VTSADFAEFDLPGPIVLERGDVARLVGEPRRGSLADLTERCRERSIQPGLVPCVTCGSLQAPRDGHMAVHYPAREATRPCPGSWPAKVVPKGRAT